MKLERIPVPSPFTYEGIKFFFCTEPFKVKSLNDLPVMCLDVLQHSAAGGLTAQLQFRLYVSVQKVGPVFDGETLHTHEIDDRNSVAAAGMIKHLQEYYGPNLSVMAEPAVGCMEDEHTIATTLGCIYADVSHLEGSHSGAKLAIYHDPTSNRRGISARIEGTGRWHVTVYTTPEIPPVMQYQYSIEGTMRIGDDKTDLPFTLTSTRYLQPLMPQEVVEKWLNAEVVENDVNRLFRELYETDRDLVSMAQFTGTYVNLPQEACLIDARDYEV